MKMTVPLEIGLVVNDMPKMIDFYVNVLGLKLVADNEAKAGGSTAVGTTPHGYRIVRLQTPYGERVKFVQTNKGTPQPAPIPKWVYERHGLCYLTFVIADMQEIVKGLKDKDVKMMSPEPVEVRPGVFCLNVLDPEGNFIEFVEQADPQAYRPDLFKWRQFF